MLARKRALLVRAANLLAEERANDAMAAIVRVVLKLPLPATVDAPTNRSWNCVLS
jgi:hypothetical protein